MSGFCKLLSKILEEKSGFPLTCHPQHAAVYLNKASETKGDPWVLYFSPRNWTAWPSMVRQVIMSLKRPDSRLGLSRFQRSLHAFEKDCILSCRGDDVFSVAWPHMLSETSLSLNFFEIEKFKQLLKWYFVHFNCNLIISNSLYIPTCLYSISLYIFFSSGTIALLSIIESRM